MDKLLTYYEAELARLRRAASRYARRYPAKAAELQIHGDGCTDQEVERLFQSVALAHARSAMRIDDNYEGLARALLEAAHPYYTRPIPSMAIAQLGAEASAQVVTLPRGAMLQAQGCKFRTAYDAKVAPLATTASYNPAIDVPIALGLPQTAASSLVIRIAATTTNVTLDQPPLPKLRLHISAPPQVRAALVDAIFARAICTSMESNGQWTRLATPPFAPAGYDATESLLPAPSGPPSRRLLAEYFALPEKFDFIDIDLQALSRHCPAKAGAITLHIALPNLRDTPAAAALRQLTPQALRQGCTPIINLYPRQAKPIKLDGRAGAYAIAPDKSGSTSQLHSIDEVRLKNRSEGDPDSAIPHYHTPSEATHRWLLDREEGDAIKLVDRDQRPLSIANGTMSVRLQCTDQEAPQAIPAGTALRTDASTTGHPVHLLTRPTEPSALATGRNDHWHLIASLAPSYRKLTTDTLLPLLHLHTTGVAPQVDSIKALAISRTTGWNGPCYQHGLQAELTVDEAAFADHSLYTFGKVLSYHVAEYVHQNRFTRLLISVTQPIRYPPLQGTMQTL